MTTLTSQAIPASTAPRHAHKGPFAALINALITWDAHYRSLRAYQKLDARLRDDVSLPKPPVWDAPIMMLR